MAVSVLDVQVNGSNAVRELQRINTASKVAETGIRSLRNTVAGLVGAFSGVQALKFVIAKTSEIETQTRSLQVLTSSVKKAKQIISELQAIGAVTPFTSTELIETAKRLTAFGVSADKVVETTRRLGDVAGATGANLGELSLAYGQVIAKGRLQGEELLQFQERGVALQDELRKMYGLTGEEFSKALSKGRISAEAVEVAIVRLTEKGGKYANGAIAQSDTLAGKFSTLTDGIETLARDIGQKLAPAIKDVLDLATKGVNKINALFASGMAADFQRRIEKIAQQLSFGFRSEALDGTKRILEDISSAPQRKNLDGINAQLDALAQVSNQLRRINAQGLPNNVINDIQNQQGSVLRLTEQLQKYKASLAKTQKAAPNTKPPALQEEEEKSKKGRSMDELIGGQIQQELDRQKALMATQKQLQLNAVATADNAEQAARMIDFAFQYREAQSEINALAQTLKKREEAREYVISKAKDKETARLALLQTEDKIRSEIQIKQEQLNTITARQQGQILEAGKKEQEQQKRLQEAGQDKLQTLIDEDELLRARIKGNEAEVILRQQLRDITKEMTPEQKAQAKAIIKGNEALKQQLSVAEQMKSLYGDIGMSIKDGVVGAIQGAIDGTKSLQEVATNLLSNIANKLLDVAVNFALFGAMSGTGTGGGLLGGLFKRAQGGSVMAGQPYLVGERGPELFMPGRSGGIARAGSFGGSTNVVVNVDAKGTQAQGDQSNAAALGRAIGAAVQAELIKQKRPGGILA